MEASSIQVRHILTDFPVTDLDDPSWLLSPETIISTYWSGEKAPHARHFSTRFLWSAKHLFVRFEAIQQEPIIASRQPDTNVKTVGLWKRDVCEIFIAPDRDDRNRYFEFEIAPTGEWIDLALSLTDGKRDTDWDYSSGMQTAAEVRSDSVVMAMTVSWTAFGMTPVSGDVWLGNIFRCVGAGETRGYLAWRPTLTDTPNFHVPERFGEFRFVA